MESIRELIGGNLAFVTYDGFPLNPGHVLIIPRRHVVSWFDTTDGERTEMIALLDRARERVRRESPATAFNIGINDGAAAGQTVPHLHIHLIPRYPGDIADPRGGIRWIIPERAAYWDMP
jgi:diadenosine tetraphosphate (Ap4A) HIT family hydrolase